MWRLKHACCWLFWLEFVCCWTCYVQKCKPPFYLWIGDVFLKLRRGDLERTLRLEVILCGWRDINIKDSTDFKWQATLLCWILPFLVAEGRSFNWFPILCFTLRGVTIISLLCRWKRSGQWNSRCGCLGRHRRAVGCLLSTLLASLIQMTAPSLLIDHKPDSSFAQGLWDGLVSF